MTYDSVYKKTITWISAFAVLLMLSSPAVAQRLSELNAGGLKLSLYEEQMTGVFRLEVAQVAADGQLPLSAEVFSLEGPVRLVVDVPGYSARTAGDVFVGHRVVKSMRSGVHKEKVRFVLDLNGPQVPGFSTTPTADGERLFVDFYFSSTAPAFPEEPPAVSSAPKPVEPRLPVVPQVISVMPPVPQRIVKKPSWAAPPKLIEPVAPPLEIVGQPKPQQVAKSPVKQPPIPAIKEPVEDAHARLPLPNRSIKEPKDGREVIVARGSRVSVKKPAQEGQSAISGISFTGGKSPGQGTLVLDGANLKDYNLLTPGDDNAYKLVVKNTVLNGSYLEYPFFPPDHVGGLEVVVAKQEGAHVVVKIYVEDGVRLSPISRKGQLLLQTSK